jgi:hypothetical protein
VGLVGEGFEVLNVPGNFVIPIETEEETATMKLKKAIACVATTVVLSGAALFASAAPQGDNGFAALQGIEAQALTPAEMQAISGQLNAYDIAAALTTLAGKLDAYPKLQAATLKLAQYYLDNAVAINAKFASLGVLTPCNTCAP